VIAQIGKVRRAFDLTTPAQEAALASLRDAGEVERRRRENLSAMTELSEVLRASGIEPVDGALGNFLYADVGDGAALFDRLLREGVIVRPLGGFGAPHAVRVTAGTPEDHAVLATALSAVVSGRARS
jgi:histidinol-phosphate aminotransferase